MRMKLSPDSGLLHAVAIVAIGTSEMGVRSLWKPNASQFCPVKYSGLQLTPAHVVSARVSSSHRASLPILSAAAISSLSVVLILLIERPFTRGPVLMALTSLRGEVWFVCK